MTKTWKTILSIERILKMWRRKNLTLEEKIIIFITSISFIKSYFPSASISNSESDFIRVTTNTKRFIIEFIFSWRKTLNHLQRFSIWRFKKCRHKIKDNKHDKSFHEWKIIPLTLIKSTFGECFILFFT